LASLGFINIRQSKIKEKNAPGSDNLTGGLLAAQCYIFLLVGQRRPYSGQWDISFTINTRGKSGLFD
jgi:hypothetical protein